MQESQVFISSSSDWQCYLTLFKHLLKIVQLSLNVLFSGMFIMLTVIQRKNTLHILADFGAKVPPEPKKT